MSITPEKIDPPEAAMLRKLSGKVEVVKQPLTSALAQFAEASRSQLVINTIEVSKAGVALDEPVTIQKVGVAGDVLTDSLKPHRLAWTIENGVVVVGSVSERFRQLETRVYQTKGNSLHLSREIESTPGMAWENTVGQGGISAPISPNALYIRQTFHGLNSIESQFSGQLKLVKAPDYSLKFIAKNVTHPKGLSAKKISVDFKGIKLKGAITQIGDQADLNIEFDETGILEEGVSLDETLSLQLSDLGVVQILDILLGSYGLTWTPKDNGTLLVTSKSVAEEVLITATHKIDARFDRNRLINALMNTTSGRWVDIEGGGGTITIKQPTTIQVRQCYDGQREIARLLSPFRRSGD